MTYCLKYELDPNRLIMAVVNDSRSAIPSLGPNADGNSVYAYSQSLIAQMVSGVILYRIETLNGNLGGVIALNTNPGAVGQVFLVLRPAAVPFLSEISGVITNFISARTYLQDILY
jgi:hypothetical protein